MIARKISPNHRTFGYQWNILLVASGIIATTQAHAQSALFPVDFTSASSPSLISTEEVLKSNQEVAPPPNPIECVDLSGAVCPGRSLSIGRIDTLACRGNLADLEVIPITSSPEFHDSLDTRFGWCSATLDPISQLPVSFECSCPVSSILECQFNERFWYGDAISESYRDLHGSCSLLLPRRSANPLFLPFVDVMDRRALCSAETTRYGLQPGGDLPWFDFKMIFTQNPGQTLDDVADQQLFLSILQQWANSGGLDVGGGAGRFGNACSFIRAASGSSQDESLRSMCMTMSGTARSIIGAKRYKNVPCCVIDENR